MFFLSFIPVFAVVYKDLVLKSKNYHVDWNNNSAVYQRVPATPGQERGFSWQPPHHLRLVTPELGPILASRIEHLYQILITSCQGDDEELPWAQHQAAAEHRLGDRLHRPLQARLQVRLLTRQSSHTSHCIGPVVHVMTKMPETPMIGLESLFPHSFSLHTHPPSLPRIRQEDKNGAKLCWI